MKTNDLFRPKFHYTSESGWINDPNGFSVYKNQYHLFAQHNPHDTKWGPMHWSHAVSDDLIKWEHKPIALTPTKDYEKDLGCFSGTAIEHEGKHVLMYTGCQGGEDKPVKQTQCIAIGDGEKYDKIPQNPVIGEKDLPSFVKVADFRDPHLFAHEGSFYVLIGAQVFEQKVGTMLLYKSNDLMEWEYVGETLRANESGLMGTVFECPNMFKLDDKYVILTSPIEMPSQEDKYRNLSSAVYFVGQMDFSTGKFEVEYYDEIDSGFDFYAPQTLEDKNGDRILIAWAQMWERNFITHELSHGWTGSMTIPRKISLKDKRLLQTPINTLDNYHGKKYNSILEGSNDCFRLKIDVDLSSGGEFEIKLLKTSSGNFNISHDKINNKLIIDRSQSMFKLDRHHLESGVNNIRKIDLNYNDRLKLDIIVDKSAVEIFINDGENSMTSNYYKNSEDATNILYTDCKYTLEKYDLTR